jgi:chromosome segregation ATPase
MNNIFFNLAAGGMLEGSFDNLNTEELSLQGQDVGESLSNMSQKLKKISKEHETIKNQVDHNTDDILDHSYILEDHKLDIVALHNQCDLHTSQISTNTSQISTNTSQISTNTSQISTNTSQISTNTPQITANTSKITTHSGLLNKAFAHIYTLDEKTSQTFEQANRTSYEVDDLKLSVESNTHRIDENSAQAKKLVTTRMESMQIPVA